MRASAEIVAKSLIGDYRREHWFTLRQSVVAYPSGNNSLANVTRKSIGSWKNLPSKTDVSQAPLPPAESAPKNRKFGEPDYGLRAQHNRILGVDLTQVPGMSALNIPTVLTKVGPDFSKFRSASAFASWFRLCSDNDISDGKIL
jgi:hypothetical protein